MITFTKDHVSFSVRTGEALLEFCGRDESRPSVTVGIDDSYLCATDGRTGVRFTAENAADEHAADFNGRCWSRAHLQMQVKIAKACKSDVTLTWTDAAPEVTFAPLGRAMPALGVAADKQVALNPSHLARIAKVAKACGTECATIVAVHGPLDPVVFACEGPDGLADVVIMPFDKRSAR